MKYILSFILCLFILFPAKSQNNNFTKRKKLLVGVKISPPFIMKDAFGHYHGVSVELWENIARKLQISYEFKEYDLSNLIKALKKTDIDLSISPLTVTSERLKHFNFTQPFFTSNLTIAVQGKKRSQFSVFLSNIFSINFFKAILLLFLTIFIFGFLIWISERKKNPNFSNGIKGMFDGIWWSAVTMTTVGYGDKTPKTGLGRFFAVLWMYIAIMIISSFTASITTALTINKIGTEIETIDDLKDSNVGTIKSSSSEKFLKRNNINIVHFGNVSEAINALAKGNLNAFVYDEPIIRHIIKEKGFIDKVQIVPNDFNAEYYSFALPHNSKLIDKINPFLIRELESIKWKAILNKYNLDQ